MRYAFLAIGLCIVGSGMTQAETLDEQVGRLYGEGKYTEVEALAKQLVDQSINENGPDHPETATSLNNLGLLYSIQGKYDLAEPLYKQALVMYEKALGPDHPCIAESSNNLALLYTAQGKYDLAEPLYKHSLLILEKTLGPDHPRTIKVSEDLAAMQAYREAEATAK
jgi:tetratricopeptide (TPR) repeat protein